MTRPGIRRIAVVGNAAPRRCGIATFTDDLCAALRERRPELELIRAAVNDRPRGYAYGPEIGWELRCDEPRDYRALAAFLALRGVGLLNVQHEFGIYGGDGGALVLELLRDAPMPVVVTLHTVLAAPDPQRRRITHEIARRAAALVVMSRWGRRTLERVYDVPAERIHLVPHGIPGGRGDRAAARRDFDLEGREVVLTFGLLGRGKGIETVIRALPAVAERRPRLLYLVVGATHPGVLAYEGEVYREELRTLAADLGVSAYLRFLDRFVTPEELTALLAAADVYCTPYPNREQVTSGTLARAVGAGRAVVSTPYWHAEELLADGRGVLFPFGDSEALAERLVRLLGDDALRAEIGARARAHGRKMAWPEVAASYLELFEGILRSAPNPFGEPLVGLDLRHIERLSDPVGMAQHATWTVPNFHEGYTTDDNARALQLVAEARLDGLAARERLDRLADRYLAFLRYAFDDAGGRFRNFLDAGRVWLEPVGSENAHARAVRALATVLACDDDAGREGVALWLLRAALPALRTFSSPRAWAIALLGLARYRERFAGDRAVNALADELAGRLLEVHRREATLGWCWFEDHLAYSNAKLPHALLEHGRVANDDEAVRVGLAALGWLREVQSDAEGGFQAVGSDRVCPRGSAPARFDQQPIEAWASVDAYLAAYRASGDPRWRAAAESAFDWFLGRNALGVPLYDEGSGGCRDGLHPDGCNANEGAESTLALWLAALAWQRAEASPALPPPHELGAPGDAGIRSGRARSPGAGAER